MKKIISILILISLLFFVCQWGIVSFKKEHEVSYKVYYKDEIFNIKEYYQKEEGNKYDIFINHKDDTYSYIVNNKYNKQKKIIKEIKYYNENNDSCIYPILESGEGTYIECSQNGKIYTETSYPNQNFINKIKTALIEEGYYKNKQIDLNETKNINKNVYYEDALIDSDIITVWNYKGIDIIKTNDSTFINGLGFDKYENNHSYLVGNYYIIPNYLSSKVLEFDSVTIINIENKEIKRLKLNHTLSSDTYINGVIDEKLYYTDPSNLLQIEINPKKEKVRLIGSKEIGGQSYKGKWDNANIYDFVSSKILFTEKIPDEITKKYNYEQIIESNMNYYFYNKKGEVYRISKYNIDKPVLLFKISNLNNFKVVDDTIYFVSNDTLYSYQANNGITTILKNNELRYNTINRVDVYRKS